MTTLVLVLKGLLILATVLFLREVWTVLRARVPERTRETVVGAARCETEIPKVIWTYWQTEPAPDFIVACLENWRRFAPDHEIRLLHRASALDWLPGLRADFDTLPAYRQADWLRIQLLARHGGVWMDASILLARDLDWLHQQRARRAASYVGFYVDRFTARPEQPIVENWLMAAVPGCPFATALAQGFDEALDIGPEAMLTRLQDQGRAARVLQRLDTGSQRYLLMHVVAADLLDRQAADYRLALMRAEDGPFAWLCGVGWRKTHLFVRIALTPCPRRLPALLKLRGNDRNIVERNWLRGRVLPGSVLDALLRRPS
ncbi:glycosyltransferase family 32 protein [Roseateles sp. LYH14W]|uniref:Glycosyltransferase family 32 protein n=1 Tax=Pelomonas parva TaxID=3299032 RepID=A0ABW7F3N1_9BURK